MDRRMWLGCVLAAVSFGAARAGEAPPEKDRQAILSMAGNYRVTFQFKETVAFKDGYELHEPHYSGATEFVKVIEDTGRFISLQHVLVLDEPEEEPADNTDGEKDQAAKPDETAKPEAAKETGPRVIKHWRQDWTYQDTELLEYAGNNVWRRRSLTPDEARGTWSQAVYQVDDSPRYESSGKWSHDGNLSNWEGNFAWRPLPRREHTVRSDYQVLVSRNRHTLTPTGWVHEQDNYKLVLPEAGKAVEQPILCRETGLNLYDRDEEVDFSAGHDYWNKTAAYWAQVRAAWSKLIDSQETIRLRSKVDDKPLYVFMFEGAREISIDKAYDAAAAQQWIDETLARFASEETARATP